MALAQDDTGIDQQPTDFSALGLEPIGDEEFYGLTKKPKEANIPDTAPSLAPSVSTEVASVPKTDFGQLGLEPVSEEDFYGIAAPKIESAKPSDWDTLRGLEVSMRQMPQLAYGVAGLVGATSEQITGYGEALRDWGFRGYKDWEQSIEPISKETDDVSVAWKKAQEGDVGALVDWAQYGIGYALGQLGETAAVALLGGLAGGAAAAPAGPAAVPAAAGGAVLAAAGKTGFKALATNLVEKAIAKQALKIVKEQATKQGIKLTAEQLAKQAETQAVKKLAGKEIGSNAAIFANSIGMELGSIYGEAESQARAEGRELTGVELSKIWGSGLAAGGLEGVTDKLGLDLLKGKFAEKLPAGRLAGAAVAGGVGVLGEGLTETAQTVIERFGAGKEVVSDDAVNEYINAASLGALGGGVIGGAGGFIAGNPKENAAAKAKVAAEASKNVAPATANEVAKQADAVINEVVQETPDQRVARLQQEAKAAAGITLEEEAPVAGLPPTPEVAQTAQARITEREGKAATPVETPAGTRIEAAAYQAPDGTVYYGASHLDAMAKARDAGKIDQAVIDAKQEVTSRETPEFGFATNADPFVSRDQAETIARESGQITVEQPATGKLHSNEVSLDAFAQPAKPAQPITATRTVADAIRDKDTFIYNDQRGAVSVEDGVTVFRPFGTQEKFEIGINPNQTIGEIEGIEWARKGQARTTPIESKPEIATIVESNPVITTDEIDQAEPDFEVPAALVEIQKSQTLNDLADLFDTGESKVSQEGKRATKVSQTPEFYRQATPQQIGLARRLIDNALRIIDAMPVSDQQKQDMAEPYLLLDQDITNYENNPEYQRYKASIRTEVRPTGQTGVLPETETEFAAGIRELEQRAKAEAERLERAKRVTPVTPPVTPEVLATAKPSTEVKQFKIGDIITRNGKQSIVTNVIQETGKPSTIYVKSSKNGKPFGRTFWYKSNDPKIQTAPTPEVREARREPAITPQQYQSFDQSILTRSADFARGIRGGVAGGVGSTEGDIISRRSESQQRAFIANRYRLNELLDDRGAFQRNVVVRRKEGNRVLAEERYLEISDENNQPLAYVRNGRLGVGGGVRSPSDIQFVAPNVTVEIVSERVAESRAETPSPIENIFDAREGIGQVPFNVEIGYRGFVKYMTPSEFRSLVPAGVSGPETKQFVVEALGRGEKLGQPFLNVEWNEADGVWEVTDHEGRSRVDAILEVYGNVPIPVHIFPRQLRAADITDQMRNASFISQADRQRWKFDATKPYVRPVSIQTPQEVSEITPQQDRDYLDAVERGDLDAASRMVDEAAKAAGYNVLPLFHGTEADTIKKFRKKLSGIWLAFKKEEASPSSGERPTTIINAYADLGDNPITLTDEQVKDWQRSGSPLKWMRDFRLENRATAVIIGDYATVVFKPSQVKSADPVTYDDQGNIIPLSQRFQPEQADIRYRRRVQMGRVGMETSAVEARLQELGFPKGGIIRVVNEPDADFEGRTIILDGKVTGIELNASAMRDNATIDRVLNHEFAESANADGALNKLVERLTPKEKKEINDTITRLRYEERARTSEEAARAIETLAEAWRGRGFFTRAVARIEAWASKLGFKLTRRAAEYIAARNLADINSGFRTAYNRFINVKGEAREGKIDTTENNKILIGNLYQDQIKSETKLISPTGANSFNHGTLGMSGGLRWRFRIKSGTLAVSDSTDTEGIQQIKNHIERRGFSINSIKSIEEAFEETHKGDAPPVDSVFSQEAFRRVGEGFKSRSKIIRMSIDDFLKLATQLQREQSQEAQNAFDAGIKWDSIPNFETRTDENGIAKIIGHEGRHRALVLKRAGYTEMPVAIIDRAIRWAEQTDPQSYDYVENFPTQLEAERTKDRIPFPFSREDGTVKYIPQTAVIRESRREPEAIPTFTEGTPEAATLKEMAASMAKVDAASEAKGGKPETYKISEIASVWMDSGLDERALQDAIVEYTNLTPANAQKVARAIAKQYGIQQQLAQAVTETPEGISVEGIPEGATVPVEADPKRPKTTLQRVIDAITGVRAPIVKITGNEKTLLKEQIKLKAAATRAAKKAQQEMAADVVEAIKAMDIRGGIRPKQASALMKRAALINFASEKSVDRFINYAEKVITNANYDKDLADARLAQKRAKELAKSERVPSNQQDVLNGIANIEVGFLDDPREFAEAANHYMRAFKSVVSEDYVVVQDNEMTSYLSEKEDEAGASRSDFDLESITALAEKWGVKVSDVNNIINAQDTEAALAQYANREVYEGLLSEKARQSIDALRKYDVAGMTQSQQSMVAKAVDLDVEALEQQDKVDLVRRIDNILVNGRTNGFQKYVDIAEAQSNARKAARDNTFTGQMAAWINILTGKAIGKDITLVGKKQQKELALTMQSVADTFRNIFGKKQLGKAQQIIGHFDLIKATNAANNAVDSAGDQMEEFYGKQYKKYGKALSAPETIMAEGIVGYLIQSVPYKSEGDSIAQRRRLIQEDIRVRRATGDEEMIESADMIEEQLAKVDGDSVKAILSNLKSSHPAAYESLIWLKDTLLPQYKEFLKAHDENYNDQTNNYENPNYLPIKYKFVNLVDLSPDAAKQYAKLDSLTPKQAANTIKRVDYSVLPKGANIDYSIRKNAFNSLAEQLRKAHTASAWTKIDAFLKSKDAAKVFGGGVNVKFMSDRLKLLKDSQERRSYEWRGDAKFFDSLATISRKFGIGYALGGIYQVFKQVPDQLMTTIANTGRYDLQAENLGIMMFQPKTSGAMKMLSKFPVGRRGDAAMGGSKFVNAMESNYTNLERYFSGGQWAAFKERAQKVNDIWLAALKKSDYVAAASGWMTYYQSYLAQNGVKFTNWNQESDLVDTDKVRQEAAAYAESMIDIYQGSSDPTNMATFAQRGKGGYENIFKAIFMPLNSFALQQRSRMISDARDALTKSSDPEKRGAGIRGLASTIGGMSLFHLTRRYFLPAVSGLGAATIYALLGIDPEEPDEEKKKEMADFRWRQFMSELSSNLFVGGFGSLPEQGFIDALNRAAYFGAEQVDSPDLYNEKGEKMAYSTWLKEKSPFWRYREYGTGMNMGMLDITSNQIGQVAEVTRKLNDPELMDTLTNEEKRLIYFAALSEWLYTLRLNDTDMNRMMRNMAKETEAVAKEREKSFKAIREGR